VQGSAARPQVARKNHDLLLALVLNRQFQAYRAQHVPGFDSAHGNSWGQRRRLIVANFFVERLQAFHVLLFVEWLERRLAHPLPGTVLPLDIRFLEMSRVLQDQVGEVNGGRRGVNPPGIARPG
jgi:hypothetical protein